MFVIIPHESVCFTSVKLLSCGGNFYGKPLLPDYLNLRFCKPFADAILHDPIVKHTGIFILDILVAGLEGFSFLFLC